MASRGDNPLVDSGAVKAVVTEFSSLDMLDSRETTAVAAQSTGATAPSAEDGEFECPLCPHRFARKRSLEEHIKRHPGETDYVCPAEGCGKRFSTTGNLARHRRRHGYIPPIKCPAERCKYSTNAAHKLARHMKIHRDTPKRVCKHPGCGKTFATTGNLNRHIRTQHLRPRGPRPGRPRGSSDARPDAADTLLSLSTSADVASGRIVRVTADPAATVDASAGAVRCHEREGREMKDDELLDTLSLFLDAASPQPNVGTTLGAEESHEGLECSRLLDELARFHAAHSPP